MCRKQDQKETYDRVNTDGYGHEINIKENDYYVTRLHFQIFCLIISIKENTKSTLFLKQNMLSQKIQYHKDASSQIGVEI